MSNQELAERFNAIRNGDKIAFEELYRDLHIPILTIIYRIVWDKGISEDILQEVFVKLFLSPPDLHIKNPRAYIFQIARNLAIDSTRKQSQHMSLDEISETVHQPLDDFTLRMEVDDALKSLPSQECQIVILHVIGGLKLREISETMNLPLTTIKWKYRQAIKKLKKIITGGSL